METKKLTQEIINKLNEPLPREAIKQHPTKKYLSTIKAIYVVERLNQCFGIGGWIINNQFIERDKSWVVVKATLNVPEYGITIPDIFGGNDNADLGDAYKGACTDALTKIGSYLGIGMDVYKGIDNGDDGNKASAPVSPKEVKKDLLTPDHVNWDKAVKYVSDGGNITDLTKKYIIDGKTEKLLINAAIHE